jgi:NAD(P)-dependent dehydrogenase (short-subunit alcohol dehydrogenase family)
MTSERPPPLAVQDLLRAGVLDGRVIVLAGDRGEFGAAVARACEQLGATVASLGGGDEEALAASAGAIVAEHGAIDVLVCDGASLFGGESGLAALRRCVDRSWDATRAVASTAFIPGERGGKVMLIAPRPDAGEHAEAARAALENTARTLSIEWARRSIATTAIAPGPSTDVEEVAALIAFIASRAGDYYSGCIFSLGITT